MLKKCYLLVCLVTSVAFGQSLTITIGTGTTYQINHPFARNYNYGWSKQIYLKSEINVNGDISAIAFDNRTGSATSWENQTIYMRHNASSTCSSSRPTTVELSSSWTLVYSGTINYDASYKTILLSTLFSYNNIDNLEIYYINYKGTNTTNGPDFRETPGSNRSVYYRSDTQSTFDANTSGTADDITNIKLIFCSNPTTPGEIGNPQTACGSFNPAAITSVSLPSGHSGTLEYKWQLSTTSNSSGFTDIASSNVASYDPPTISQTTWYRRLARVNCKSDWTGALVSNVVAMEPNATWVGGSAGNWNTATNWCGGIPTSTSAIVLPANTTITLDANASVASLTIPITSAVLAGSNSLTIANAGSLVTNGTFTCGTGTVVFAGTATLSGSQSCTFSNLILNGALTVGTAPTVNSSVTVNNGGSINQSIIYGASSSLIYNVNGSYSATSFEWPTTNKPMHVTFQNLSDVTLNSHKVVDGTLSLLSGKLALGAYNLTLNGSLTGGSATSYINSNGTGLFYRASLAIATSYSFPIGQGAVFAPISIVFNAGELAGKSISVATNTGKVPNLNTGNTYFVNRHWIVEPSSVISSLNYTIALTFDPTEIVGSGSQSSLLPIKKSNAIWYKPIGSQFTDGISQGTASSPVGNVLTWSNLTTFSAFGAAGDFANPLPVELVSFQANCIEQGVALTWQTASEHSSAYFEVERSVDNQHWNVLETVQAAGNSTSLLTYGILDPEVQRTAVYYRLKQTDYDGAYTLYDPISIQCGELENTISTYPNPSSDEGFQLLYGNALGERTVGLKIMDARGNLLYTKTLHLQTGVNVFNIYDFEAETGIYFLQIQEEGKTSAVLKHMHNSMK